MGISESVATVSDFANEIAAGDRFCDAPIEVVLQMADDAADLAALVIRAQRMSTRCRVELREETDFASLGYQFWKLVEKHATSYCEAKAETVPQDPHETYGVGRGAL